MTDQSRRFLEYFHAQRSCAALECYTTEVAVVAALECCTTDGFAVTAWRYADAFLAVDSPNFIGDVLGEYAHGGRSNIEGNECGQFGGTKK